MGMGDSPRSDPTESDFRQRFAALMTTVDDLPSLPQLLWELQAVLHQSRSDASELADVVAKDPSLVTNVLRLANSSWFGFNSRVTVIRDAVTLLGRQRIEQIANTTFFVDAFSPTSQLLDLPALWRHSFRVACVTRILSELHPRGTGLLPEGAYSAGLLHDVGKLILEEYFPEDLASCKKWQEENDGTDAEADLAVLGMDHGEIGGDRREIWNLPDELVEGVRAHHNPGQVEDGEKGLPEMIRFADEIVNGLDTKKMSEGPRDHPAFGLSGEQFADLQKSLEHEEELIDIMIGTT